MYKKGDPTNIQNFKHISLLSHIYKLLMKVFANRFESKVESYQPVEQAGFRTALDTNDHLLSIKILIERPFGYNRQLVLVFVVYRRPSTPSKATN